MTAPQLEMIPPRLLEPAADNPRSDVGDVAELAETIKHLGVLEPLVVAANGELGFTVIAGHRRLAAAKLAGLDEVPCVVHLDVDDRTRSEMMLVENLQREDLSVLEEATAYQRLIDLGHKQRDLAKIVGRSQSHISKRTALLKIPAAARAAVDAGGITIEEAQGLAKLPADAAEALFARGSTPTGWQIDSAVRKHEEAKKRAALQKELEKQGIAITDLEGRSHWSHLLDRLGLDPAAHASEPCHAAVITYAAEAALVCVDPERHEPDGASDLKASDEDLDDDEEEDEAPPADETAEQRKQREQAEARRAAGEKLEADRRALAETRTAFAARLVDEASDADAIELTFELFAGVDYIDEPLQDQRALEFLGLWDGIRYRDKNQRESLGEKLRAFGAESRRNQARALVAVAVANFEATANSIGWRAAPADGLLDEDMLPEFRTYLAFLEARGYQRTQLDREILGETSATADILPPDFLAEHDYRVTPVGRSKPPKKWKLVCACGFEAQQTTEDLARQRQNEHLQVEATAQGLLDKEKAES